VFGVVRWRWSEGMETCRIRVGDVRRREGGGVQTTAMPPRPIWRRRDGCVSSAEGDTGEGVREPSEKIPPMGRVSIS
jgi:hypothetical protein